MNDITWHFEKPPITMQNIQKLESAFNIQLPYNYRKIILNHHGARPNKKKFETYIKKQRMIKTFLPILKEYKVNVFSVKEWLNLSDETIPFASIPSGDYICFNFHESSTEPRIVLHHHEIDSLELISKNFDTFLNQLQ